MEDIVVVVVGLFCAYLVVMALARLGIEKFERSHTPWGRMWGLFSIVFYAVLFLFIGVFITYLIYL
jgi:hypothetical protein